MKRMVLNFEHKTSYASVDEAFAAYAAEAHKMDEPLANLGLSVWTDAENYAIGIKDNNDVIKPLLVMVYNKHSNYDNALRSAGISMLKDGSYTIYNGNYAQKLTSDDVYYSAAYAANGNEHNYQFYPYVGKTFYTGQSRNTIIQGEYRTSSSSSSPSWQNPYYLGNNASRFLQLIVYYNSDSAFFCTPARMHATPGVSADGMYITVTAFKKIGDKLWVFPKYMYSSSPQSYTASSNSYNGYYGIYFTSLSLYDENHPESDTYTMNVKFGNRELAENENAVIQEVQTDAEGNTLGDEVYVGVVPAPNGRYYINNKPYFFINGLGVKDED